MFQKIIREIAKGATDGLKHDVEEYADKILRRMLRALVLGGLGVTFLATGSIFAAIGIVAYLSTFMSGAVAWGVVGLVVALVGALLLLLVRR